jgi:D-sedoheptulose 7-phosphate isomerase
MATEPTSAAEVRIRETFKEAARIQSATGDAAAAAIGRAAAVMCVALRAGGKIIVFGNGGSAADSQHFAAELVGRFQRERRPLSAVALTTDTSVITAVANDYAYEQVFARQVAALGRSGDVAFGISTSGRSVNVLRAFEEAKRNGLTTVALVGDGGEPLADVTIHVPTANTARIQEAHRTALHALCGVIEEEVGGTAPGQGQA